MRWIARSHRNELRFAEGFLTPFQGLLPDQTLPSRRDSKYAMSIRQWRFAEWCELGATYARRQLRFDSIGRAMAGLLATLYDHAVPRIDTGRSRSTADAERSEPATALTRADLSWRALLCMDIERTESLPGSRTACVFRRRGWLCCGRDHGRTYVALEGGHTGGGHGHPDRLALTVQRDRSRWLEDPGTGSYVDRSLHWYRSTLAHSAPLINGASQRPVPATLLAFEDRELAGWIVKRASDMAEGVVVQRTIVVCDDYLIDRLEWKPASNARDEVHESECTVAVGRAAMSNATNWQPAQPNAAGGLEDGFDFLRDVERATWPAPLLTLDVPGHAPHDGPTDGTARAWYAATGMPSLWRAVAPGPPECAPRPLHWITTRGCSGQLLGVWSWSDAVGDVAFDLDMSEVRVTDRNGVVAQHAPFASGWRIRFAPDSHRDTIVLSSLAGAELLDSVVASGHLHAPPVLPVLVVPMPAPSRNSLRDGDPGDAVPGALTIELGADHYLQTEAAWQEAGAPTAVVQLVADTETLMIDVAAHTGPPVAPPAGAANPLDNERADVNADGVQLYVGDAPDRPWRAGWLAVPDRSPDHIRASPPSFPARRRSRDDGATRRADGPCVSLSTGT